jgi:hypothetical protein
MNYISLPNIIRVIKSRIMRCAGHVAFVGDRRGAYSVFGGKTCVKETTWKTYAYMGG